MLKATTPSYWRVLPILALCYLCSLLDRQILSIVSADVKVDLNLGDFQLSLLLGLAFALFYILFGVPLGMLADRWSRSKTICLGIAIWTLGTIACGLSFSFVTLFLARAMVGAGEAALSPAAYTLIADTVPRERLSLAIAAYNWAANIGTSLSLVIGGLALDYARVHGSSLPVVGHLEPWQLVFLLVALPGFIVAPLALTLGEGRRGARQAAEIARPRLWPLLRSNSRFYATHFLGFGHINIIAYGTLIWTPLYMSREFGLSSTEIGLYFGGLVILAFALGSLLLTTIVDRAFVRGMTDAHLRIMTWVYCLSAPAAVLAFLVDSQPLMWTFLFITLTLFPTASSIAASALQVGTHVTQRGMISGAYVSFANILGAVVGPSLIGALTQFVFRDEDSLGLAMAVTFGIASVIAIIGLAMGRAPMRRAVAAAAGDD